MKIFYLPQVAPSNKKKNNGLEASKKRTKLYLHSDQSKELFQSRAKESHR